jgi:hypothetical protein
MTEYKRSTRNAYMNKAPKRVKINIALQLPLYIPAMHLYKTTLKHTPNSFYGRVRKIAKSDC